MGLGLLSWVWVWVYRGSRSGFATAGYRDRGLLFFFGGVDGWRGWCSLDF